MTGLLLPVAARGADDSPRSPPPTDSVGVEMELAPAEVSRMGATLEAQVGHARLWYWGWSGFFGALITVGTVTNGTSTGGQREAAQVNMASGSVYLFVALINPPPVAFGWEPVGAMPEATAEQRAAKARAIHALFESEVRAEHVFRSVFNQVLGLVVNAGVSAYMYWALHLGGRALLNLGVGSAVWEARVFTSPNAASLMEAELHGSIALELQLAPVALGPSGAGMALIGRF